MRRLRTPGKTASSSVLVLLCMLFLINCGKRVDLTGTGNSVQGESDLSAKFFSNELVRDADVRIIMDRFRQKNDNEHFLVSFVKNNGFILWNDAQKIRTAKTLLVLVPFAFENHKWINGFIICRQNFETNSASFDVFTKWDLRRYGFNKNPNEMNAAKVQSLINYFNFRIHGISSYTLQDSRQLPDSIRAKYPDLLDREKLIGKYKIGALDADAAGKVNSPKLNALFDLAGCFGYWEYTDWWYDPDGDSDPCHCSGNEYFAYSTAQYVSVCFGGGGNFGSGDFGGGYSAGGSGSGNGSYDAASLGNLYDDSPVEYTDDDIDDNNFDYAGPGVLIPSSITLTDGSVVEIKFGRSQSDGKSANQPVAPRVLECLVFALNDLNNNGTVVTSLEINCTTNGKHSSPQSNHYKGLAVDIDMINGSSVSSSLPIANQLQLSLDKYPNIRENFGPFFKHKFTGAWPTAPDHNGHIHFSVNGN